VATTSTAHILAKEFAQQGGGVDVQAYGGGYSLVGGFIERGKE
jgi:hypothetical protein